MMTWKDVEDIICALQEANNIAKEKNEILKEQNELIKKLIHTANMGRIESISDLKL